MVGGAAPLPDAESDEACDARARRARITYFPKQRMVVDTSATIDVTATAGEPGDATTTVPLGAKNVPQQLQCAVRARLVGTQFAITPHGWDEKSFLGTFEVHWTWVVTPHEEGKGIPLILEVQGLRFDDRSRAYMPAGREFQTTAVIQVNSEPQGLWTRVNGVISGVVTHPLFAVLVSTGAIGFLVSAGYKRTRSGSPPAASPPPLGPGSAPGGSEAPGLVSGRSRIRLRRPR